MGRSATVAIPTVSAQALDLEQFGSVADPLETVNPGDRYVDVAKMLLPLENGMSLTLPVML